MWNDHCLSIKHKLGQLGEISVCCFAHLFPFTETNECQLLSPCSSYQELSQYWLVTGNAGYARQWQQIERQCHLHKPLTEWARFWCILALICLQNERCVSRPLALLSTAACNTAMRLYYTPFLMSYTSIHSLYLTDTHTYTQTFIHDHTSCTQLNKKYCGVVSQIRPKKGIF